jgi:hypothetical protein
MNYFDKLYLARDDEFQELAFEYAEKLDFIMRNFDDIRWIFEDDNKDDDDGDNE